MRRYLLAQLILALLLPAQFAKSSESVEGKYTKMLEDSDFVDFGKQKNKSAENTKQEESEFAKSFCQERYKENKNQVNCIKYLSPYGESLRKVKEPFWLGFCMSTAENENIVVIPSREVISYLNACLKYNAKVKTPNSLFDSLNISFKDAMTHASYDTFSHKGKLYTASRICEPPRKMVWTTSSGFLGIGGKVEEIGCMTRLELDAYNRELKLRRESRPIIINNPAPYRIP